MTELGFLALKSKILQMLTAGLDPRLTYHNRHHTEDVLENAERIAAAEAISDSRLLMLIKIAALFHDTGFLNGYAGHEEGSCRIMLDTLDPELFIADELGLIADMIMATKMPQSPLRVQERILCDADLDYLGRDDFPVINNRLKNEWLLLGLLDHEEQWNEIQVQFLNNHHYFTNSSIHNRTPGKIKHLESLKMKLNKV